MVVSSKLGGSSSAEVSISAAGSIQVDSIKPNTICLVFLLVVLLLRLRGMLQEHTSKLILGRGIELVLRVARKQLGLAYVI